MIGSIDDERMEYILCAAIYYDDGKERVHQPLHIKTGIVITGHRHCNCFQTLYEMFPNREYIDKNIQGFLTNKNRFVNREWAARIAFNARQTSIQYGELTSERLY